MTEKNLETIAREIAETADENAKVVSEVISAYRDYIHIDGDYSDSREEVAYPTPHARLERYGNAIKTLGDMVGTVKLGDLIRGMSTSDVDELTIVSCRMRFRAWSHV